MATTLFVDGVTKIQAAWLNSINDFVYTLFKGATTSTQAREAIHAVSRQGDNLQGDYVIDGDLKVSGDFEFGNISVNSEDVTYDGIIPEDNVKDALDSLATTKENLGAAQGLLNDHVSNPDPHTQYLVKSRSLADIANSATARTNLGLGGLSTGNNASDVPYDNTGSGLPAVDVQGAIDALIVSAEGVLSFNGRTGIVTPQAGDYNKTQIGLGNVENWPPSSQSQAEAGTDDLSYMTPLKSRQGVIAYTQPFTSAEKTKLGGIEEGATANQTDTYLLDRGNHTGTQSQETIEGLTDELSSLRLGVPVAAVVESRSLTSSDAGAILDCLSPDGLTLTIPSGTFAVGTTILITHSGSTGFVSVQAGAGVTLEIPLEKLSRTRSINSTIGLVQVMADRWKIFGELDDD